MLDMTDISDTVEELETALQTALYNMENVAARVHQKEIDAYQGFLDSEKYKDEIIEIGNKLKEKGIDITERIGESFDV